MLIRWLGEYTFQKTVKRLTLHTDYSPVTYFMVLTADKVTGCNTFQETVKVLTFHTAESPGFGFHGADKVTGCNTIQGTV